MFNSMLIAWLQAKESEYHNAAEHHKLIDTIKYSEYKGMESAIIETRKYINTTFNE